jgi:hypothetical protein
MATIHGRKGKITIGGTIVAEAREWTLKVSRNLDEDMAFGDDWKTQLPGVREWSGTIEFNFDPADTGIIDAAMGATTVSLALYPQSSATLNFNGAAWLDADITVGTGGTARGSGTFTGEGTLTKTP